MFSIICVSESDAPKSDVTESATKIELLNSLIKKNQQNWLEATKEEEKSFYREKIINLKMEIISLNKKVIKKENRTNLHWRDFLNDKEDTTDKVREFVRKSIKSHLAKKETIERRDIEWFVDKDLEKLKELD